MFRILQPITNWLLIAVVVAGQLPALIHRVECIDHCAHAHSAAANAELADTDLVDTNHVDTGARCEKECCKSHLAAESNGIDCESANSEHSCEDCTICQSLFSANGLVELAMDAVASELLPADLLLQEQAVPILSLLGISQSRAPPHCSA